MQRLSETEAHEEEFLGILSAYQGIIHKVGLVYFRREEDRRDNFQEVVAQLWRAFDSLRDRERIGSWIYAVAINTSISRLRKESRTVLPERMPELPQAGEAERLEHEMDFGRLLEAIRALPALDRSIMLLWLEECDYGEIARIVGLTPGNVGVRVSRAKKKLKRYLTGEGYGKG